MYNYTSTYISYQYKYRSLYFLFERNYLNGENFVVYRYRSHPTEKIILRKRDPPQSLKTHYQVQNETQIRINQKVGETMEN